MAVRGSSGPRDYEPQITLRLFPDYLGNININHCFYLDSKFLFKGIDKPLIWFHLTYGLHKLHQKAHVDT